MAHATRGVAGDLFDQLRGLTPGQLRRLIRDLCLRYRLELIERWQGWAQDGQCEPPGDWRIWMIRAGRGFGKTRAGAEWISEWARMLPGARIALVAANDADGRRVMIEGPSGLLAVARSDEAPRWREGLRELHFSSGAVATLYSAAAAENLRGPEHHVAWCDELAKWPQGEAAWDNLMMGLRLGEAPRVLVTTTPKPTALMRRIMALPGFEETRGGTNDNPYLPSRFVDAMVASYGGTRLGRQELEGEWLEDVEGALWTRGLPGTIRLRHYEPERDYQLGQQTAQVAGGGVREERIDLPAVLSAGSARALAQTLAAAAADGRETVVWTVDLAALALPVGRIVASPDGSRWLLTSRTVREAGLSIELQRYQPVTVELVGADPGRPVRAPDWPDAEATAAIFDIPGLDAVPASASRLLVAAAGSNDGWRGADIWIRPAPEAEPIAAGYVRPAAALGALAAPLATGSGHLFDTANEAIVELINPSMTLESVDDFALLAGANLAMLGDELVQFGRAEMVAPRRWRLSRLLRGRRATDGGAHGVDTPFVLLGDPALLALPDDLARLAESGSAALQWTSRGEVDIRDIAIAPAGRALRPVAPVHGQLQPDGLGGAVATWIRRSRADPGWRDQVDLPLGESREAWRIELVPPVPGIGPWETSVPMLSLASAEVAAVAPGHALAIRQVGDFALSPPLVLPLT